MSTQPVPQPSWKQEVNRRIEAHKNRRGISVVDQNTQTAEHNAVSDRAAQAAARVAARFSKAPSYSEMQSIEARAALRTAEAATRAALEAQAAAQAALDSLTATDEESNAHAEEYPAHQAATDSAPRWEPEPAPAPGSYDPGRSDPGRPWEIRWEPDMPLRTATPASASVQPQPEHDDYAAATVEPAQPIHANLIHFPRELVATRRMRPRIATTQAGEVSEQLSIFEVDPSSISIDPMASAAEAALPAPSWCGPEWSRIELDAHPRNEPDVRHNPAAAAAPAVHLAPLELRLMAAAIDIALIVVLVCACAVGIAGHMQHTSIKFAEMSAVGVFILMGILYQAFFLLTTRSTPGMRYAGIALCTFDDEHPTRAQLRDRLGALLVSILPVGLGMAWAIFDEDHLCWHDRHSRTYQRKC